MNNKKTDIESLPVAEPLVSFGGPEDDNTNGIENASLLASAVPHDDKKLSAKKKDNGPSFAYPQRQLPQDNNTAPAAGYWGRFDDAHPASMTVLGDVNDANHDDDFPVATARLDDRTIRHAFIRKVYMILSVQLLVTFACCAIMTLHEPTRNFVLGPGMSLNWLNFIVLISLICALSVYKRTYPKNFILLGVFTLCMSYNVGTITAIYAQGGAGDLVLEAIFITATVFIVLTVFTLQSKWDFSFMGAGLGMGLWIMILWGMFGILFGLHTGMVYALGGSVLFSGYIIYDTYLLAERHDPKDYVIAAIELYLDLINLFLYILRLLSELQRR